MKKQEKELRQNELTKRYQTHNLNLELRGSLRNNKNENNKKAAQKVFASSECSVQDQNLDQNSDLNSKKSLFSKADKEQ